MGIVCYFYYYEGVEISGYGDKISSYVVGVCSYLTRRVLSSLVCYVYALTKFVKPIFSYYFFFAGYYYYC